MNDSFWPILLKKSAMLSNAEKYAPEIEIRILGRRFRPRISRDNVQNRCFRPSIFECLGKIEFFNRIGRWQPFVTDC